MNSCHYIPEITTENVLTLAFVYVCFTVSSIVARETIALIRIDLVCASTIITDTRCTIIDINFTAFTCIARTTGTLKMSNEQLYIEERKYFSVHGLRGTM